ncbi:MAG: hypothetical protein SPLUMA1_SPLUMAMAG1_00638 [uncultured Sulfurimonas sp.]|nr:MAG: hypothetical protein SPLUMA1_SPLUMAMAG1_00638 [uncultured Sulfurimonas sp.]
MQIQKLQENDLELFYKYAKEEQWDIEDIPDSFAFLFAYKDGYKITIKTQDINHGVTLFFALCQNYESNTSIYMLSTLQEPILEALVQALSITKVSHQTRMYNKILTQ